MARFGEHYTYNVDFVSLAGGSGTTFTSQTITVADKADFNIKRLIHQATSNAANLKIQDLSSGRFLFKTQKDLRIISGTALSSITANGFIPFNLPKSYMVNRLKQLQISAADSSGSTNTIRLALHGDHIYDHSSYSDYDPTTPPKFVMPMVYETSAISAGSTINTKGTTTIQIDDDADFICTKLTGQFTGDGQISITNHTADGSYAWQNSPTDAFNIVGNSQFPHVLTSPRFLRRRSTLYIEFTNLTNLANSLTMQLHGYKRFTK